MIVINIWYYSASLPRWTRSKYKFLDFIKVFGLYVVGGSVILSPGCIIIIIYVYHILYRTPYLLTFARIIISWAFRVFSFVRTTPLRHPTPYRIVTIPPPPPRLPALPMSSVVVVIDHILGSNRARSLPTDGARSLNAADRSATTTKNTSC